MTLEEARRVAAVIAKADNGCPMCVRNLCAILNDEFPEFHFHAQAEYEGDWFAPVHVSQVKGE
jgi:hypothetical protein